MHVCFSCLPEYSAALAPSFSPASCLFSLGSAEKYLTPCPSPAGQPQLVQIWRITGVLRYLSLFSSPRTRSLAPVKRFRSPASGVCYSVATSRQGGCQQCITATCLLCWCAPSTLLTVFVFTIPWHLSVFPKWAQNWSWTSVRLLCEPEGRPFSRQKESVYVGDQLSEQR